MAGLVQTVAPGVEPVSLADMKLHLRQDTTDDEALISILISAARRYVESRLAQQLITATWQVTYDRFPYRAPGMTWQQAGDIWDRQNASWLEGLVIRPPRPPLQAVQSVKYVDTAGVTQTLASSQYLVDTASMPGRIMPIFGQIWPVTQIVVNAAIITYTAGYGATADLVPAEIVAAIKMLVGHWYIHREAVDVERGISASDLPLGCEALLNSSWHGEYV